MHNEVKSLITYGEKRSRVSREFSVNDSIKFFDKIVWNYAKKISYKFVGRLDQEELYQELRLVILDVYRVYDINRNVPFEALLNKSLFNKHCKLFQLHKLHRSNRIQTTSYDEPVSSDIQLPKSNLIADESENPDKKIYLNTTKWPVELKIVAKFLQKGFLPKDIQGVLNERFFLSTMPNDIMKYELVYDTRTGRIFSLKQTTKMAHYQILNSRLVFQNIGVSVNLNHLSPYTLWRKAYHLGLDKDVEILGKNLHYEKIAHRVLAFIAGSISYDTMMKFFRKKVKSQKSNDVTPKVIVRTRVVKMLLDDQIEKYHKNVRLKFQSFTQSRRGGMLLKN